MVDQGKGPGGAQPPGLPHLFLDQTELRPKGQKKFFGDQNSTCLKAWITRPTPYLKVWIGTGSGKLSMLSFTDYTNLLFTSESQ